MEPKQPDATTGENKGKRPLIIIIFNQTIIGPTGGAHTEEQAFTDNSLVKAISRTTF